MEIDERIPELTRHSFEDVTLDLTSEGRLYVGSLADRTYRLELVEASPDRLELLIDGLRITASVSPDARAVWVTIDGRTYRLSRSSHRPGPAASHAGPSVLTAPMPGQVRAVNITAGDLVTRGQSLVILEAMKMEIRLNAPFDGKVLSLEVRVGQTVEREQLIARLQPH